MKNAYIFPGQGSQYPGMANEILNAYPEAAKWFSEADAILGFPITEIMKNGNEEEIKQTKITQPAVFLHSVIGYFVKPKSGTPSMVAGHSLGEFSALVAAGVLDFESGLKLVYARAMAMQKACEMNPGTMAAILNLPDLTVEEICQTVSKETGEIVIPANYNCPGQLVISGSIKGVEVACEMLKTAGAKRALILPVGGAFHSPLMEPARIELAEAISKTTFHTPSCPVYQNVDALPHSAPDEIKQKLIEQLTAPVRWTQSVEKMYADGANKFIECGPGKVLQGLVKKIKPEAEAVGL
jgi:[acyl-carrier-protein] S-malonyltransferase